MLCTGKARERGTLHRGSFIHFFGYAFTSRYYVFNIFQAVLTVRQGEVQRTNSSILNLSDRATLRLKIITSKTRVFNVTGNRTLPICISRGGIIARNRQRLQ